MSGSRSIASEPEEPETRDGGDLSDLLTHTSGDDRARVYWIVGFVLLLGTLPVFTSSWSSDWALQTVMEVVATMLAFTVGAMALVSFYARKRGTLLYIGTGFIGTGVLDAYHAVLISPIVSPHFASTPTELLDLSAWSWTASRLFLSLFMYVSWLAWRQERWTRGRIESPARAVYFTAATLTLTLLLFFTLTPASGAHFADFIVHRPAEFIPAFFFLLALGGYVTKGAWRQDPFEHWLLVALVVSTAIHALYMPFAGSLYDAPHDVSVLLKIVSYGAVLVGIMSSVYDTLHREEQVFVQVRTVNEALAREVSVRREAERVLQRSEMRLQDFLENANDLVQSTAPDGTILYVNRAWKETLGYTDEQLKGLRIFDVIHPARRDQFSKEFSKVLTGEALPGQEVEFLAADLQVVLCSGASNCRFVDGKPVAVQSIFRDVTKQRRAEQQVRTSQANLQALVENTGDVIWSVDKEHRLITFNLAFSLAIEARIGREPKKGDPPELVFRPNAARWFREAYVRALEGRRFSDLRETEVAGQERSYEFFFNPIQEGGGTVGVAVFGRDVTRRLQAEAAVFMAKEEAEAANRAKSQFLASMSHELRTPLNSVIGFANILLKNKTGSLEAKELGFLTRILANGRHLLGLINEVLDLAKIESGKMEADLAPVDLSELVTETVLQLDGQVRERNLVLRSEVPPGLDMIETDEGKLRQVIINLVGNALKFTEGGEVSLSVSACPDGRTPYSIAVTDTGIGIPEERLKAIFEAFQQADSSTSRRFGGTGLGLTISRSICLLLGYDLVADSVEGEGSTFTILLRPPSADRPEDALVAHAEELAQGQVVVSEGNSQPGVVVAEGPGEVVSLFGAIPEKAHRILVIDDESDSRLVLTHYLSEFGCEVLSASSAQEGFELARSERPDLITLDLQMPGMGGWEALKILKDDPDLSDTPVVVVSIVANEQRGELLGAVDLVNKPVERDDLLKVLSRNLVPSSSRRVLVVDDEDDVRQVLDEELSEAGYQVFEARNGFEALEQLDAVRPSAILLDLTMPVMDGLTFLQRLRERPECLGIPVIVITAKDLTMEEEELIRSSSCGLLEKGEVIESRLHEILGGLLEGVRTASH